jgi:large subunit ribosomal protein L10
VNRPEKTTVVEELNQTFSATPHVILASFRGLTVNQATLLRSRVRQTGGRFRVIKNRLARRAAAGTPMEPLVDRFAGPCAVALHVSDPVALAKTLAEFSKENPQLEMLAGIVDARDVLDVQGIKQLASLPGLPELRAQLLCLIQTPATQLVRLLDTPGTQVARVVDARREQQEQDWNK